MLKESIINKEVSTYTNGKIKQQDYYVNHNKHGISKKYYPDGNVFTIETWYKGKKHGSFEVYDQDGKRVAFYIYIHDKLLRSYL